jgi:hypothetical protein
MSDRKLTEAEFKEKYPNSPEGKYSVYSDEYDAENPSTSTESDPNQAYIDALMSLGETAPVDYNAMYDAMAGMYEKISASNEAKFNKYWPESITQGVAAGQVFDTASRAQANAMNDWLGQLTSLGNQYMRGEAGKMNQWMTGQVADVNAFNSDQFYAALDKAMPGIMNTAADYKGTVDQMLTGQLPTAVKDEIAQAAAERGLSAGSYGPSYNNAQLRDLGINRLQYLQAGQAQMPQLMGLTQALTAPVATPNIYQNVMMTPTPYTPTMANTAGIAGNYLSSIMGQTMMQPAAGVGAATQMGGVQAQINMANTQLQYSKAQSMLNYGMDQQNLAWNQEMFKQQTSDDQQMWNMATALMGSAGGIAGVFAGL